MNVLVLLVGGNPIANVGLIKYFSESRKIDPPLFPYDTIVLVYTSQTELLARNIKRMFKKKKFIDVNVLNNERDVGYIAHAIQKALSKLNPERIHLNYTGGTKPMSLGSYMAVDAMKNVKEKVFSDIHPTKYKLYLLRGEEYPKNGNIAEDVETTIEDFCLLQGAQLISSKGSLSEFYNKDFVKFLFDKHYFNDKDFFEIWSMEFKYFKKLDRSRWIETLHEVNTIDATEYINLSAKKLEKLHKFVRGGFLEEYIFDILKKTDGLCLKDIRWNVHIVNRRQKEFEIDVLATKGYTAYVFSCTTDKKKFIKQKAFEASVRAEQIGGIGAKPILVCFGDKSVVEKTKDEMINNAGKNSFEILGFDDLVDEKILQKKLFDIFGVVS